MSNIVAQHARLPQNAVNAALAAIELIRPMARLQSPSLTLVCRQAGLPLDLAEMCAGLLASVFDDLTAISNLPRNRIERSKRLERVVAACHEPAASALKLAMACSPINGRTVVRHWDVICERGEVGRMAWLLGMQTDTAYEYGKKIERRG